MPDNNRPRRPWLTIVLAILAAITFLVMSDSGARVMMGISGGYGIGDSQTSISPSARDIGMPAPPDYYLYPGENVPVTDTREFLKMNYQATMRTRNVQELTRRAETTIRGFAGRVDRTSSSDKYGYVNFVVPASKFEAFRDEVESFVSPRFLKVDISSQNLLPQKQSIEEQQKSVEKSLADIQAQRKSVVSAHASAVKSLQAQIDEKTKTLEILNAEKTANPARQTEIDILILGISNELSTLRGRLADENTSYSKELSSIDSQIKYTNDVLNAVKTQDQNLLDNVATVNGTISLQWISIFGIIRLYLPGYWIPFILAILAVLAYRKERRGPIIK